MELFGGEPTDRTSREVSVQDVLAELIAGQRAPWFQIFEPTGGGQDFLRSIARLAFDDEPVAPLSWFVSEYALPVPDEWRAEIGVSYGCPDFACGHEGYTFVIELKTERGSYRRCQMSDYLRLARRLHPDDRIDMVLLPARGLDAVHPGFIANVGISPFRTIILVNFESNDYPSVSRIATCHPQVRGSDDAATDLPIPIQLTDIVD